MKKTHGLNGDVRPSIGSRGKDNDFYGVFVSSFFFFFKFPAIAFQASIRFGLGPSNALSPTHLSLSTRPQSCPLPPKRALLPLLAASSLFLSHTHRTYTHEHKRTRTHTHARTHTQTHAHAHAHASFPSFISAVYPQVLIAHPATAAADGVGSTA